MTRPSDQNDFTQTTKSNNSNSWLWIPAGLGCGCLGLIIIIGILAAIAVPSFLQAANRARQAEAKKYLNAANRAQQAYRLSKPTFANSIEVLNKEFKIGITPETENYSYKIVTQPDRSKSVMITAVAKKQNLKSYIGAVFALKKGDRAIALAGICETKSPSTTPPAMPTTAEGESTGVICPANSRFLEP